MKSSLWRNVKLTVKISSIFVAFLENMDFNINNSSRILEFSDWF